MAFDDAITVYASGVTVNSAATSATYTLPTTTANAPNNAPRYVRVITNGNAAFIKFGPSTVSATTNDALVNGNKDVIFNVWGLTHFAVVQDTAAAKVNVVPLENC